MSDTDSNYVENYEKTEEVQESRNDGSAASTEESTTEGANFAGRQYPWEETPKPIDEETASLIAELEEDLAAVQDYKRVTVLIQQGRYQEMFVFCV